MQPQPRAIHFRGTYRYASRDALERALAAARTQLDEEEVPEPSLTSLRSFASQGTKLRVDVVLPAAIEVRFAAAAVFEALAERAIEGAVEAVHAGVPVDLFPSGTED